MKLAQHLVSLVVLPFVCSLPTNAETTPSEAQPLAQNTLLDTNTTTQAHAASQESLLTNEQLLARIDAMQLEMDKLADRVYAPELSYTNSLQSATGLEVSGFMDAVFQHDEDLPHGNDVYLNQVEVDLAKQLNHHARASLGIVYGDGFDIGVAQIEYALIPESENSSSILKIWNLAAGQFDAPFGEDVSCYASNTRRSVSVPEIVENTHCLWNDIGVNSTLGFSCATVDMYLVRGFSLHSDSDLEEPKHTLNAAFGSRLNYSINHVFRLGGSTATGWLPNGNSAMHMHGLHSVYTLGQWSAVLEGILLQELFSDYTTDRRGFYLQTVRELGHCFALVRADYTELENSDQLRSLSLGGGARLGSGLECRCEFKSTQKKRSQAFVQLVASF